MKKINWGIIGLGNIAHRFSKAFAETENSKLLAIASKDEDRLKKFRNQFNIDLKFSFKNYQDLINCHEIDIVYIALPNSLHKQWILNAIENKKNILVEKPFVINFSEAQEIKEYLKKTNIFFSEAFMYRYHPQLQSVIKMIKDNKIGNLLSMESSFGENILTKKNFLFFNKRKKINLKSRKFNKKLGGGCILDLGCYPTSFSLLIGSLRDKLNINNFELLNVAVEKLETGVDIDSRVELIFEDGFKSKIHSSFKNNIGSKSIIYGEKGSIFIENTWSGGNIFVSSKSNFKQKFNFRNNKSIYGYQIEEISRNLTQGLKNIKFPIMTLKESLLNMKIIDGWLNYSEK